MNRFSFALVGLSAEIAPGLGLIGLIFMQGFGDVRRSWLRGRKTSFRSLHEDGSLLIGNPPALHPT